MDGRPNAALVIVDVQTAVMANTHDRDTIIANIRTVVDRARDSGTPVIWVQHEEAPHLVRDTDDWRIVAELDPRDDEPVIAKSYGDSFEGTELEDTLARLKVGRIYVAGAQTDQCIRGTLHGGLVRGYDTILVSDAHTTEDFREYGAPAPDLVIAHTNLYWEYEKAQGLEAGVATAGEISFAK
jgi:nicotinamidase-related amidase